MSATPVPVVFVVDDEEAVGDSLAMLLRTVGLPTRVYRDPRRFLDDYRPEQPGCLLLDVRMPQLGGLEVQRELGRRHASLPIIFITGHGDIPMAVEAMRKGAFDFIEKPFDDEQLLARVREAFELQQKAETRPVMGSVPISELSERQREVLQRVLDGKPSRQIAEELEISVKTVEFHRARIMQKLGVRTAAELFRRCLT